MVTECLELIVQRYFLAIDNQWQWIWAAKRGNELWFHYRGETFCTEINSKKTRRQNSTEFIETGEIKAPMPGKIIKIFKKMGERVQQGEKVLVMEAMKMEYSLEADRSGTIEKLNVDENDQVNVGQLLVKISKEKND